MDTTIRNRWVDALLSGEYKQGKGALENDRHEFCCLGVLCDLARKAGVVSRSEEPDDRMLPEFGNTYAYLYGDEGTSTRLPNEVLKWAGLPDSLVTVISCEDGEDRRYDLAELNDEGHKFQEIAEWIENAEAFE